MTTYVDSSVLLRVLFGERDPLPSWADIQPISSELLKVECLRVVDRARVSHGIDDVPAARLRAEAIDLIRAIPLVSVTTRLLERAADPFPTLIGTLDAIHLATALALRDDYPEISVATHDRELATAARAVGFDVEGVGRLAG